MRIVSLLPSATEIVALLGKARELVARSHECDWSPDPVIAQLPVATRSLIDHAAPAAAIDATVREAARSNRPLNELVTGVLEQLRPDVILTQGLCPVCAIDPDAVRAAAQSLPNCPEVVTLSPAGLEDVLDDVLRVARAIGAEPQGERAVHALRERLFRAQEFVTPYVTGPVVAFLEWTDPPFVAGHWTVQMIERAGGLHPWNPTQPKPLAGAAAGPQQGERLAGKSVAVDPALIAALNPERVVLAPCGMTLARVRTEAEALMRQDWFRELPAVRAAIRGDQSRVALVDGNQMFNRPGPRVIDAFEWLVGWLNDRPELTPEGFPWEPLCV
ncbi:MAG: hypothetical protein RBS39_02140 [Phycisphaerales bacterium]|nr:hypothetical protein [Phycisphaerales bacterium]